MRKLKNFLQEHKQFYLLLLLIPILIWFRYLEISIKPRYIIHSSLDDLIPMLPVFVIPYLLWFPYIAYGLIYTGIHSKRDFYRLLIFLAGGMSLAYIIYMIFPNGERLRPEITGNDPFSLLVKFIYVTDTPTNVCPSVHIINTIAVHSALWYSEAFRKIRFGRKASAILALFICFSTVLIKQHSIIDVACGFVAGGLFYIPLYLLPEFRKRNQYGEEYTPSHYEEKE